MSRQHLQHDMLMRRLYPDEMQMLVLKTYKYGLHPSPKVATNIPRTWGVFRQAGVSSLL